MNKEELLRLLKIHTAGTGLFPEAMLAQMITESGMNRASGLSELSEKYNNYSGQKASGVTLREGVEGVDYIIMGTEEDFDTKEEAEKYITDQEKSGNTGIKKSKIEANSKGGFTVTLGQPFRIYSNPEEGVKGHIRFLTGDGYTKAHKDRYAPVLQAKTPEEQIKLLKKVGYATDNEYVETLTGVLNDTVRVEFPEFANTESAKTITPLQQSAIDSLNEKLDAQIKDFPEFENMLGASREGIKDYILRLENEDDVVKAADLEITELVDVLEKDTEIRDKLEKRQNFERQVSVVEEILSNKSKYPANIVRQAQKAKDDVMSFQERKITSVSPTTGISAPTGKFKEPLNREQLEKSLQDLENKKIGFERADETKLIKLPTRGPGSIEQVEPSIIRPEEEKEGVVVTQTTPPEGDDTPPPPPPPSKFSKLLKGVKDSADEALFALSAGAGIMSIFEATRRDKVTKATISPLFKEAVMKTREAAQTGMPYEQRMAALKDINNAYSGAMKNVMSISGGQRGVALANIGAVDTSRVNALVDLASKSADLRQKNLDLYAKTAAAYSQQKLSADMNHEKLKQTVETNRKARLSSIGQNLFREATEFSRNYMDVSNIVNDDDDNANTRTINPIDTKPIYDELGNKLN